MSLTPFDEYEAHPADCPCHRDPQLCRGAVPIPEDVVRRAADGLSIAVWPVAIKAGIQWEGSVMDADLGPVGKGRQGYDDPGLLTGDLVLDLEKEIQDRAESIFAKAE